MNDKMKYCDTCGAEIAIAAKTCPHCGAPNRRPVNKKTLATLAAILTAGGLGVGAYYGLVMKPQKDFDAAHTMLMNGQVEEAYAKLQTMREETELQDILYQAAIQLVEQKQYDSAEQIIGKLGEYEGVKKLSSDINFGRAQEALDAKDYDKVLSFLSQDPSEEAIALIKEAQYLKGVQYYEAGKYEETIAQLSLLKGYKEASSIINDASLALQQEELTKIPEKIAEMESHNSDTVGWLYIPDTEINNAVVQAKDNEFYRRKNEMKEYSWTGCYFADYECAFGTTADDLYRSTVIYGHNMDFGISEGTAENDEPTGERFSQLFHYADKKWAAEHPYFYFATPQQVLKWEVFTVAYTNTDFNYIQVLKNRNISNEQITPTQMMDIVNGGRARSEFDYEVDIDEDDKIIILSTNSYKYGRREDIRLIVMAKLVTDDDPVVAQATISINTDKIEVK